MNRKGPGSRSMTISGNNFEYELAESQRRKKLQHKLSSIDKKLVAIRSSSSSSGMAPPQDTSFTIDYMSPQVTSCPHCFESMPTRDLRKHMAKFCKDKMVPCAEIGCGLMLPQSEMKKHLAHGCAVARQRRAMATSAIKRKEDEREALRASIEALSTAHRRAAADPHTTNTSPQSITDSHVPIDGNTDIDPTGLHRVTPREEYTTCTACQERIRTDEMRHHVRSMCRMRNIYCPNRHLGCMEEIPLAMTTNHLRHDCAIEKHKDELVAKSRQRYEKVTCTGCAEKIPLMYLRKHETEDCPNRKVPCRNHLLGCPVMVRIKDRKHHEDVDNSIKPRSCLFFDGCDTTMKIDEDDVPPPWTVEFWIFRPSLLESARSYLREVRRLTELYRLATFNEFRVKAVVVDLQESVREVAAEVARKSAALAKSGQQGDKDDQMGMTEITMQLAGMIQKYEIAAVETIKIAQLLTVALAAAMSDIRAGQGIRDHKELLDIEPDVDGIPCRQSYKEKSILNSPKPGMTPSVSRGGSRTTSRSVPSTAQTGGDDSSSLGNFVEEEPHEGDSLEGERETEGGEGMGGDGESIGEGKREGESIHGTGEDEALDEDEAAHTEGEEEGERVDIPPGYENIISTPHDFDWGPKLWKEWGALVADIKLRLTSDQEVMHTQRVQSGLVRESKKGKEKKKKKASNGGDIALVDEGLAEDSDGDGHPTAQKKKDKKNKKMKEKMRKIGKALNGESRFTEVAAAVRNLYQGSEALCSSDHAAIYMNMSAAGDSEGGDIQGKIGFCDAVWGNMSFDINIVREQWTHVAIMCTVEPKRRVLLYCDGGLVATVKDTAFDLPMKSIGSPHLSFHGYMLDCRYWAKSRSVPEIKLDMRCLLKLTEETKQKPELSQKEKRGGAVPDEPESSSSDPDLTGSGLVAWWTFEDGGYSTRVRDISDHRFPTLITGGNTYRGLRQTAWFEAGSMLPLTLREHLMATALLPPGQRPPPVVTPQITIPLPSYVERNLCPFEVRRAKLAQRGRALLQEKKCPNGCDARVRKVDMRFHLKFECSRRRIECRHHWCTATFFAEELQEHERSGCALVVARDRILEKAADTMTVLQCSDCSAKIQARNMMRHMEQSCPYRKVRCPHPDCQEEFPAHQKRWHISYECRSEAVARKKWLIQRARERLNYPRPWGVEFVYSSKTDAEEEHVEQEDGRKPDS